MGKWFCVLRASDAGRRPPAGGILGTFLTIAFLVFGLLVPLPAYAGPLESNEGSEPRNENLKFSEIHVQVWPEYDSGEILVLSEFALPEGTELPVDFSMAVPKGARIYAFGQVDSKGQYISAPAPPEVDRSEADWDVAQLSFSEFPRVRFEYYYNPGLNLNGEREFEFVYELPAAAEQASLAIQEPARASAFRVDPPFTNVVDDPSGFTYHMDQTSGAPAGSRYSVTVSYTKPDAEPSVTSDPNATPSNAGSSDAEHAEGGTSPSFLIAMGAVVVASLGSIGFGLRRRRKTATPVCSTCGEDGLEPDGSFCTRCGARSG
ncbi:MAG: hypothetical protein Kow00129_09430 [Thermoleophilia bacterium]